MSQSTQSPAASDTCTQCNAPLPPSDAVGGRYCSEACWNGDPDAPECSYCDGPRDPQNSVEGSWCSVECYHLEKGENAIAAAVDDHRFCATCFRQKKTVARPSDAALSAQGVSETVIDHFDGIQYPTEHAVWAVREDPSGTPFEHDRDDEGLHEPDTETRPAGDDLLPGSVLPTV